jgi:hypothetical protein
MLTQCVGFEAKFLILFTGIYFIVLLTPGIFTMVSVINLTCDEEPSEHMHLCNGRLTTGTFVMAE